MSLAASNGPDAKKFRFALPTQVVVKHPLYDLNQNADAEEAQTSRDEADEAEPSSPLNLQKIIGACGSPPVADVKAEAAESPVPLSADSTTRDPLSFFFEQASVLFKNFQSDDPKAAAASQNSTTLHNGGSTPQPPLSIHPPIPGALAVAASPAAKLFREDDWSWHRNPAASIRSGGTNKQTPVWKYFVYNKTENLSRCIIGDCTYMLKGPHTSTLACHLKKHPHEYAEFQRLKADYTKDRNLGTVGGGGNGSQRSNNGRASSAASNGSNSSAHSTSGTPLPQITPSTTPKPNAGVNALLKRTMEQSALNGIFGSPNPFLPTPPQRPNGVAMRTPPSMNEILNSLSARAIGMLPQSHISESPISASPIALPPDSVSPPTIEHSIKQSHSPPISFDSPTKIPNVAALFNPPKKWPKTEKRQRELEIKLALCLLNTQPNAQPFLRLLMETAQPRFQFPDESQIQQTIEQMYSRTVANIKLQISSAPKATAMIGFIRAENSTVWMSVSASFYSATEHRIEAPLLGVREVPTAATAAQISALVEKIFSLYNLKWSSIVRTIVTGADIVGIEDFGFPSAVLRSYRQSLRHSFQTFVDSQPFEEIQRKCGDIAATTSNFGDLEKLSPVDRVVNTAKIGNRGDLDENEWRLVDSVRRFHAIIYSNAMPTRENGYATVDRVVPDLMQLLVSVEKDFPELCQMGLADRLRADLGFVLDPESADFDPTFTQATALNPQLILLLDESQLNTAKQSIGRLLRERIRLSEESAAKRKPVGVDSLLAAIVERRSNEQSPDPKSMYPDLLEAANLRRKQMGQCGGGRSQDHVADALVQSYIDDALSGSCGFTKPMEYWNVSATKCPQLSELAAELLFIPSAMVAPEEILQQDGIPQSGDSFDFVRRSTHSANIERDSVVRFDRSFWQKPLF